MQSEQGSEADDRLVGLGRSVGTLAFARPNPPTEMAAWSFEGVDIAADGAVTPQPPVNVPMMHETAQSVPLTYVPADSMPPGRYLIGKPDAPRAWMLDVGPAPTP